MTINEAITQVLSASHHGDHHFRTFLLGDDPEVVAMRAALVQLADAVRDEAPKCSACSREVRWYAPGYVSCDHCQRVWHSQ